MFDMQLDRHRWVLRCHLTGFWTLETVEAYGRALIQHGAVLVRAGRPFKGIADSRTFPVQSTEVSDALGIQSKQMALPGSRMAVLVASTLSKKQVERTMPNDVVRVFVDEEEALAWLASPYAPPPDAYNR